MKPFLFRKLLRNSIVFTLTLTTVLFFSVMVTPAGALAPGETLYLTADEYEIESASVCFYDAERANILNDQGTEWHEMTDTDGDGVFSIVIPENTEKFSFNVTLSGSDAPEVAMRSFDLSQVETDFQGNMYHAAEDSWSFYNAQPLPPLPDSPDTDPEETTAEDEFSYNDQTGSNTATITPSGTVGAVSDAPDIVSVDLSWEAMEFTYTPASQGSWDADEHTYVSTPDSWTSDSNTITVTNHSNVDVTASFDFESAEDLDLEGEFHCDGDTVTSVDLASAENPQGGAGTATSKEVTFHITDGAIEEDTDNLGTITITISK